MMTTKPPAGPAASSSHHHHSSGFNRPADGNPKKPVSNHTEPPASVLLDRYEIECITRELNRFLLRAATEASSGKVDGAVKTHGGGVSNPGAVKLEGKGFRGLLVRRAVAFCGSGEVSDVVVAGGAGGRRGRGRAAGKGVPYLCN